MIVLLLVLWIVALIAPRARQTCVFVMPFSRDSCPNTPMEAGAMGLQNNVTDINGSREIVVDGENGLIVPPHKVQPLYEAMERMMMDDVMREKMQRNVRPMIEARFEKNFCSGLLDIFL